MIIGPRSRDQLEQNLTGLGLELAADEIAHLDRISGPVDAPVTGSVL